MEERYVDWDIGDFPEFYRKRMQDFERLSAEIEALKDGLVDDYESLCDFASEQISEAYRDGNLVSGDLSADGIVLRLGDVELGVRQVIPWPQIGMVGPGLDQLAEKLERFAAHIREGIRKGGDIDDFPLRDLWDL